MYGERVDKEFNYNLL